MNTLSSRINRVVKGGRFWSARGTPLADRFWAKVDKNGPISKHRPELGNCWIWIGGKSRCGYGSFNGDGGERYAHRWAYRLCRGPIQPGMEIDHLCAVKSCCNPAHLEAVTYCGAGLPPKTLDHEFRARDELADIEVDELYIDDASVALPKRPAQIPLSLAAFATDRLGGGVSWPIVNRGMRVQFLIRRGILDTLARHRKLPPGYDEAPHAVNMDVALSFFGKALR